MSFCLVACSPSQTPSEAYADDEQYDEDDDGQESALTRGSQHTEPNAELAAPSRTVTILEGSDRESDGQGQLQGGE